jgi:PAS domain S-box-containing protein
MQDGFAVFDAHGIQSDVNPALCRMTGFSREELMGKSPPYPYWPPEENERIQLVFIKTLNQNFGEVELIFRRKSGERFPVIVNPSSINDKSGVPLLYLATVKDITDRKNLENDLRAAVELRDEFMSIASHELKTPLTALSMQIQLLSHLTSLEVANEKIADLSNRAYRSIKSLINLLNDLLDVTRIRVGKLTLEKESMDLRVAVRNAILSLQEETDQKGISVTLEAVEPVQGKWDSSRINQVLSNLLSNAIKYGEGRPIEISLSANQDSGRVSLLVKDYGMGISPEMQTQIFERFQRAVSSAKISGLGLGLYIVQQIIDAHGGSIRVESQLKEGALFIVELPML